MSAPVRPRRIRSRPSLRSVPGATAARVACSSLSSFGSTMIGAPSGLAGWVESRAGSDREAGSVAVRAGPGRRFGSLVRIPRPGRSLSAGGHPSRVV